MPEPTEVALFTKLFQKTEQDQVDWHPLGLYNQLATSFVGKYTIILTRTALGTVEMTVKNLDGDQLAHLTSGQMPQLVALFELAKHYVRKLIDDQLDEIVKELDKSLPEPTRTERARLIEKVRESKGRESENK